MRRESSTVVVLAGAVTEPLLASLARSPNVSLVRPPDGEQDSLAAAALALGQAARAASPYVLVPADPLAAVAAEWAAMWDLAAGPGHAAAFEERTAEAVTAWRAGRFELPDYYVVLTPGAGAGPGAGAEAGAGAGAGTGAVARAGAGPQNAGGRAAGGGPAGGTVTAGGAAGMYLGPLRAVRGRRVQTVVTTADGAGTEDAERVLQALRTLRHGPWWPPLDELLDRARHFFAGSLGASG